LAFAIGGAVHTTVVQDDQDAVFCTAYIHFEYVDTKCNGLLETINGVFRPQSMSTSVSNNFNAAIALIKKRMVLSRLGEISGYQKDDDQCQDEPKGYCA
jgi:hypothetical protein